MNKTTVVTGFWSVKNKHGKKFDHWLGTSLKVNCPYIFFCDKEVFEEMKKGRGGYETHFIDKSINNFSLNLNERLLHPVGEYLHPRHVPSLALGKIWLEKIFLVREAVRINPYNSEWFAWVDAGFAKNRSTAPSPWPWPDHEKMKLLKKGAINYTASYGQNSSMSTKRILRDYKHSVAGTAWVVHKDCVEDFCQLFDLYVTKTINEIEENGWTVRAKGDKHHGGFVCLSDQIVWSRMKVDYPKLFNRLGQGFGKVANILSTDPATEHGF